MRIGGRGDSALMMPGTPLGGLLLFAMAVILLTPKPLASLLDFNTYTVQSLGFLLTGYVIAWRAPMAVVADERLAARQFIWRMVGTLVCTGALELLQPVVHRGAHWFDFSLNSGAVILGGGLAIARETLSRDRDLRPPLATARTAPPDLGPVAGVDRRFFIVSTGRSGSTLLAAVLADAGADFGMRVPTRWDRQSGDMEHTLLSMAAQRFLAAHRIAPEKPDGGLDRLRWTLLRSVAKRQLATTLGAVQYVKVYGGQELPRPAFKLGYFPSIIISYRRFEDYAVSLGLMRASASVTWLEQNYRTTLRTALWLLNTFGGCVVSYEQLADPDASDWAGPLSNLTGIPALRLIQARDARLEQASARVIARDTEAQGDATFAAIDALKDQAVPPSAQVLRSWVSRRAAATRMA